MDGSNVQTMRKTLEVVRDALSTMSAHLDDVEFVRTWIALTKKEVDTAISTPMRNCDVGSAEEQFERFNADCAKHDCYDCDVHKLWNFCKGDESCHFVWAQMPYVPTTEGDKV